MSIKFTPKKIQEETDRIVNKIYEHYVRAFGPAITPLLEREESVIRDRIGSIFNIANGKLNVNEEVEFITEERKKISDLLFNNVFVTQIPQEFWSTPFGSAFKISGDMLNGARMDYMEIINYLGADNAWLQRNWEKLGGYRYGGRKVADRLIVERFKEEILEGKSLRDANFPRGYWNHSEYWNTPLGKHVRELNDKLKNEPEMVGLDYVWKNIIGENNRSRYWVYKYADRLGGVREGRNLSFDPDVVRKKAREMGVI